MRRLSRREMVRVMSAFGLSAMAGPFMSDRLWAKPIFNRYPFPLGVASSDPVPDGAVLWTRLAPEPLEGGGMPTALVEVDWEIAADERFQRIAQKGTVVARPELGSSQSASSA